VKFCQKRKKNRYWLCIKIGKKKEKKVFDTDWEYSCRYLFCTTGCCSLGTASSRTTGPLLPEPGYSYGPKPGGGSASGRTCQAPPALCGGARKRKKGEDEGREEKKRSARIPPSVCTKNSRDSFALGLRQTIMLCCIENCASADLDLQSRIAVSVKNGAIFFDEEMELCVCLCVHAPSTSPLSPHFLLLGWINAKLVV
jgi:hypothetical protein